MQTSDEFVHLVASYVDDVIISRVILERWIEICLVFLCTEPT